MSAREAARDQLLSLRLQLEAIGEDGAEVQVRRAVIETCLAFGIPTHLSAAELIGAYDDTRLAEQPRHQSDESRVRSSTATSN